MSKCAATVIICAIVSLAGQSASCLTLRVPSQYATIALALSAAAAGDTVEVAFGTYTYTETIEMKSGVVLRSETGDPECVTLRPVYSGYYIACVGVNAETVIEGFTLTGSTWLSALVCEDGAAPTIRRCVFRDNLSHNSGFAGAATCTDSAPFFLDCSFSSNGGYWSSVGGVWLWDCDARIQGCVFYNNSSAAVQCVGGVLQMEHVTFAASPNYGAVGLFLGWGAVARADHCIVANGDYGVDCYTTDVQVTLTCCDVHGNAYGDWVGCIADQYGVDGNICEDPQFCDPSTGDLRLQSTSPCAPSSPPNPECGLIGALPVGCGGTAVQHTSWGGIKELFRE